MFRRAENVTVTHQPNLTGNGPVHLQVGNRSCPMNKMHKDEFQYWKNRATQYPVCFGRIAESQYWLFHGMVAMQHAPAPTSRGAIPDDLKRYVWQRDRGRCRQFGSNIELQFDHLIPLAFGGATTEQNLQILCGPCNRRKGASII